MRRAKPLAGGFLLICDFVMAVAVTVLWFASREVMKLGGFVASGGPYVIAHPALGWMWVLPVSVVTVVLLMFVEPDLAEPAGGQSLRVFAWSGMFLSLGYNFLEFGLRPPGGVGLAWAWIACGVLFVPMGAFPLYVAWRWTLDAREERRVAIATGAANAEKYQPLDYAVVAMQVAAVVVGVGGGALLFSRVAG